MKLIICDIMYCLALTLAICTVCQAQNSGYDPFRSQPNGESTQRQKHGVMASGEFVDTPITDVFRVVSDLTGWSILTSPEVSQSPPKVNLWVKGMKPEEVMDRVVMLSGLVAKREGNTFNVMTFDEYTRQFKVERIVRQLKHITATEVVEVLRPFVEKSEVAMVVPASAGNKIVLLMPQPLLGDLERLIDALDVQFEQDVIEIVRLKYLDATTVVPELEQFLVRSNTGTPAGAAIFQQSSEGQSAGAGDNRKAGDSLLIQFMVEPELNVVVLRGLPADVTRAKGLLKELDQPSGIEVVSYELKYTDAEQAYETIEHLTERQTQSSGAGDSNNQSTRARIAASTQNNRIIVEGSAEVQEQIAAIIAAVDQPLPPGSGDIRVYRLENATADEVVGVLVELLAEEDADATARTGGSTSGAGGQSSQANASPAAEGQAASALGSVLGSGTQQPRVTAAPEINAVVIRASAAEHNELTKIISQLDQPRDQVQIEVMLVNVLSNDEFRLGVEVGSSDLGSVSTIGFTNFGVGTIDPATGSIRIPTVTPAFGLDLSVFNGEDFSLVLNALKTVGETKISSAPKLLVADNSPGVIRQIDQEPFEVASQGDSTTLTSFGGFVDAGTTLNVTPHISRDDWLRLDYEIILSTFGNRTQQQLQANLPPPRTENTTNGTVRIPAGHVVVLGGLVNKRDDEITEGVPFLSDIPWVGELLKNRRDTKDYSTLYIFIRPVILRDPEFRDLLLISEDDINDADIDADYYPSNPLKFIGPVNQTQREAVSP